MFKHSMLQIYVYEIKIKNKISINRDQPMDIRAWSINR